MRKKIFIVSILLGALAITVIAQEMNQSVTLKGQVVCSSCWYEADRKTTPYGSEGDVKCAVMCGKQGIATALAVMGEQEATLYLLEYGKFKKTGQGWLDHIGKQVEATGTVREKDGKRYLKVDAFTPVSPSTN
jgi:hypothetical protein